MERAEWRIGSCAAEPYRKTNEARMDLFQYSVCLFQNVFFDTNDLIIHVIYVHEYYKHYCSHLAADLCRDAGKLWVGGKCGQVFHSLDERSRGDSTSVPVLLREIPIQRLERERIHQNDPTSITKDVTIKVNPFLYCGMPIRRESQPFDKTGRQKSYLDGFYQVGGAVGHLLGRLDKVPLGRWVGCLGGSQAAGIAQCRRVLSNNGGCRENLPHYKQRVRLETNLISAYREVTMQSSTSHPSVKPK